MIWRPQEVEVSTRTAIQLECLSIGTLELANDEPASAQILETTVAFFVISTAQKSKCAYRPSGFRLADQDSGEPRARSSQQKPTPMKFYNVVTSAY